ncbi:MAG: alpha/beta fold hydrolase [candidate division FCPU426 bacterium]
MSLQRWLILAILVIVAAWSGMYFWRFYNGKALYPVQGEYVKVEQNGLYVLVRGEGRGPAVLFLSGFPYHSESFFALASRPPAGYRFITLDFPGLGWSEKKVTQPLTPADMALQVKLALDKLEIQEVILVGHDLGGGVALVCASMFPQLVKGLMLIAPDSSCGSAAEAMGWWWGVPWISEAWASLFLDRGFIRRLLSRSWTPGSDTWHAAVEKYVRPLEMPNGRISFLLLHRGRLGFDYRPYEERLGCPVTVLWGEKDRILPASLGGKLVQGLNQARFTPLPGLGHMPQEEAPDQVYPLLEEFLRSLAK